MFIIISILILVFIFGLLLWKAVISVYILKRFYEKQGIPFVNDCHVVIGAELEVSKLFKKNKTHDWLSLQKSGNDLIGTIRGFSVQLFAVDPEISLQLIHNAGTNVERDTPALHSFGRLSPNAITFKPSDGPFFKERKLVLQRIQKETSKLNEIAFSTAEDYLSKYEINNGSNKEFDVKELLAGWTRETSGTFIWGTKVSDICVKIINEHGNIESMKLMTALNLTFTDLRFYSHEIWNRIFFPLSSLPITFEARRLSSNIDTVIKEIDKIIINPEPNSIAEYVIKSNSQIGIPAKYSRDDLIAATVAGLDTVKSATMSTIWFCSMKVIFIGEIWFWKNFKPLILNLSIKFLTLLIANI